ncbi:uncharacterized protein N7459_009797 [Penicillium hispanicum]|uniref:uncharacterized protein n=1 Tax=Penicillium hispanicum TaxID=1080232 RepID=UPI002541140C|nr:uncharacterized protein N7459_009797 [Penicillium hispanicum]KAJ5570367.1 hypothetical protein N7459_009797 [Penicillium hispanicum]
MFVRKTAIRTSRRRQRTSSDDSVKPPKAKRQRSALRQADDCLSADVSYGYGPETADFTASALSKDDELSTDHTSTDSHLPTRSSKPNDGTKIDPDGAILLSNTNYYSVEQLPALPDQLRGSQSSPLRCFFATGYAHALALTHTHAIVWPYSVASSAPSPSETFTVPIPGSCSDPNGAVPLGTLLSPAAGEYPGLLVIVPRTGKIIYWETVTGAASLGLSRHKQNGIQGSTPGLLSGEYATDIMNCEPSGIIVSFSSGRVAHITLRDSQGKPSVLVNFLRSTVGAGSGGILGGIKSVLGGSYWRREVIAVRAGASRQRGQRDVIIATSAGVVEIWDTHWNHGNALKKKYDFKDDILAAIPRESAKMTGEHDLKVMDFAFAGQQPLHEAGSQGSDESWRLFLVVASPQLLASKALFVLELNLSGTESRLLSIHSVNLHCLPAVRDDTRPKIMVSKSEDTAFILMGSSIVILSLVKASEETPISQLLLDSEKSPLPFQDTINLRSGIGYEILGHGTEDVLNHDSPAACLLMVRNFGVIRVNVAPRVPTENDMEESQLTAKHKIEQAIFFGTIARNPLDLADGGGLDFPASEIERASLEICQELLRSQSHFIPHTAISIDQSLRLRAKALGDLAALLQRRGNPLSRPARWELLWAAERLAAQRAMWNLGTLETKNESPFLTHVIESMNDKFKTRLDPAHGETNPVRQWFLRDSYHMEHIIPWIKNAIKPRRGNSSKQARKLSEQILGASEVFLAIMETAYQYREQHASLYGLGGDFVEDGVLADGFGDLSEFWTSRAVCYTETGHLLDWELDSCRAWIQQKTTSADAPDGQVLRRIAENSARHLRVLGQMHRERTRWLAAQDDPKLVDESELIERAHVKERKWQLFKLAGIGHLQDALSLAERFRDMGALVELVIELQDQVKSRSTQDTSPVIPAVGESEADVNTRISQYFDKFGESWAEAYFSRQISMGHPGALLSMRRYQQHVTRFLRKTSSFSKLSWINDVNGEEDYETAALCLESLALGSEKQLWCHRVQVSLAKLGQLASCERTSTVEHGSSLQESIRRLDGYSEIDEVQDTLRTYIQPVLEGAIDQKAGTELALDYFGGHILTDRPSLHEILADALSTLVNRSVMGADSLIDLLTLIGSIHPSEDGDSELRGRQFYQALRVLDHSCYTERDPLYVLALRKLIWRRCMIKDDWEARGKVAEESNGASDDTPADTVLYQTLCSCLTEQAGARSTSLFQPLAPSEALMADSESEILVSRFRPEQRARVITDLRREDEILREYINVGRLDFWYQDLRASIES